MPTTFSILLVSRFNEVVFGNGGDCTDVDGSRLPPRDVVRCHEEGVTREEFLEIFSVGLVVGGSIVIPQLRRAMEKLEALQ